MLEVPQYAKLFIGLLSIVNPMGALPIFLSMTQAHTPRDRNKVGLIASFSVAVILAAAVFVGEPLLNAFGIGIPSFRVAGGILILLMALSMLNDTANRAKKIEQEQQEAQEQDSLAIVPLSMPLLAGPGAISTVIVFAQQDTTPSHYLSMVGAIALVGVVVFIALRLAPLLARILGPVGLRVLTRIMGLFLAAIGIEFMANGLGVLFPGLKS